MPKANCSYPFLKPESHLIDGRETLRQECVRLRREVHALTEFRRQAHVFLAEFALNSSADVDQLRSCAFRLLPISSPLVREALPGKTISEKVSRLFEEVDVYQATVKKA